MGGVSTVGGPAGGNVPNTNAPTNNFKSELKTKSDQELFDMLKDPKLSKDQLKDVVDEILSRRKPDAETPNVGSGSGSSGSGGGGGGIGDMLAELLKKLLGGIISPEDMEKLKGLLKGLGLSDDKIDSLTKSPGGQSGGSGSTPPPAPNSGDIA